MHLNHQIYWAWNGKEIRFDIYQNAYQKNAQGAWEYFRTEVRFSVVVENDNEFLSDPDHGNIVEAKWVSISNLEAFLDWGETTELIKRLLIYG